MLAVIRKTIARRPTEIVSPDPGLQQRFTKSRDEILRDFQAAHPAASFCTTFAGDATLASLGPHAPLSSFLHRRLFCSYDNVYCVFVGSIHNLRSLVRQYGLSSNSADEALLVIELYRTMRDRGSYLTDKALRDIAGSFAFVVYDNVTGVVFAALSSDGGVSLYWGVTADGLLVIGDEVEIVKGRCAKSNAPFPAGCMFHSEGGLRSFEHPMNEMRPMNSGSTARAQYTAPASTLTSPIRSKSCCGSGAPPTGPPHGGRMVPVYKLMGIDGPQLLYKWEPSTLPICTEGSSSSATRGIIKSARRRVA